VISLIGWNGCRSAFPLCNKYINPRISAT